MTEGIFEDDKRVRTLHTFDGLNFLINNVPEVAVIKTVYPDHDIIAPGDVDTFRDLRDLAELFYNLVDVLRVCKDELTECARVIAKECWVDLIFCIQ